MLSIRREKDRASRRTKKTVRGKEKVVGPGDKGRKKGEKKYWFGFGFSFALDLIWILFGFNFVCS